MPGASGPLIYVIAGEPSGDALGGPMMGALKTATDGACRFSGVGGQQMTAAGLQSLFPMEELTVMGLAEVVPRIPQLLKRINQVAQDIVAVRPDAVVTIDAPDFSFRVARRVRAACPDIPLIHYVAPTVWAWRPGRAAKIAKFLDHVLCLFPFEPAYFHKVGLTATFVGHPLAAGQRAAVDPEAFRTRHAIGADDRVVAVLPGSRRGEVSRLLPVFRQALDQMKRPLHSVIPALDHVRPEIDAVAADWPGPLTIVSGGEEKTLALTAASAALAASGTVTLELALAGVPTVIGYKVSPLSAMIARRLVRTPHVGLPNILAGREVAPEFIQERCTPENLSRALTQLLDNPDRAEAQRTAFRAATASLRAEEDTPGAAAANAILGLLGTRV